MNTTETVATRSGVTLRITRQESPESRLIELRLSSPKRCLLHWGLRQPGRDGWQLPPAAAWPPGTRAVGSALQTPCPSEPGRENVQVRLPAGSPYSSLEFVLYFPEQNSWDNNQSQNYRIELAQSAAAVAPPPQLDSLADQIVQAEMNRNSWTLMHRFNLCHDLLDAAASHRESLALLFVWLRYSALRQLAWQRNYNTKPRELSHAQDRLTRKLAALWTNVPDQRPLLRLILTTVGPGGDGQRIRDEILNIMHRHHIKEVAGHFLEEWHQKLHNNTTPDDIVICEAYLEFLYSRGNLERFYKKLQEGGVTRQRLASLERPIRSDPFFVPHLRDGLISDFQHFLRVLRSVHAATDLETTIQAARPFLDGETIALLGRVWEHRHGQIPLPTAVEEITEARRRLHSRITQGSPDRALLYLDLALEQFLRLLVERNLNQATSGDFLVELIAGLLDNRLLSEDQPELALCRDHWRRLKQLPRFGADWSLHAKSVADRIGRVLANLIDQTCSLLQPRADLLGRCFKAESWVISLFSEEVVRGGSLDFALSLLLRYLEPVLRRAANLGNWQIVSRGIGRGVVEVVENLGAVQGRTFDRPRVVLANRVNGNEEIPDTVAAVLAPDVTDIVSHVAVRARNAGLLFASCYDRDTFERLKQLLGRTVLVEIGADGAVQVQEIQDLAVEVSPQAPKIHRARRPRPRSLDWALSAAQFDPATTGGKSLNLERLAGQLPGWIQRPCSIAVPFGVCERLLGSTLNRAVAERQRTLLSELDSDPARVLPLLRENLMSLASLPELTSALQQTATQAGLPWPPDWESAWRALKRVWASKWNDRACQSRRARGVPHDDLFMAVLIQQVIPADYAFVLHTVNPFNDRAEEIYIEIVIGLGETLVGNYAGRALSAICDRKSLQPSLLSYPSKSVALRGTGLIFRSDSNDEDLEGFAGAGLYDSVLLTEPQSSLVQYSDQPLVWDEPFRRATLQRVAELGLAVEAALGAPQDVEGVVSQGQYFLVQTRPQVGLAAASAQAVPEAKGQKTSRPQPSERRNPPKPGTPSGEAKPSP